MVLYELFCIARPFIPRHELHNLVKATAFMVLDNNGVVREINSLGGNVLPYKMRANATKPYETFGTYYSVMFDSSPTVANALARKLRNDDRLLRFTVLKQDDRMARYGFYNKPQTALNDN